MKNLGKNNNIKILLLLITMFSVNLYADGVRAILATSEVVQGNSAQLRLQATGQSVEFPNIRYVNKSEVVGRHESSSYSYSNANGTSKSVNTTTLTLTFFPQEDMLIPPYDVTIDGKTYTTEELNLKVVKSTVPKVNGKEQFALQLRLNKKSVMIGEPIIATVYFSLQHGVRLSENPQYNQPEFKGFFAKQLGEAKQYNEGSKQVSELKYALTPKEKGKFSVGPATAKVGVADRTKRDMFGRFFGTVWTPISSNIVNIEVLDTPEKSDLIGTFTLDQNIDSKSVKANKPVNLNITISGEGSLEDFELEKYEIDGVTVFSDDADISTNYSSGHIKSTFSKKYAFIADKDFTIPAREISVYDTKSKSIKILKIPSYEVKVESKKAIVNMSNTNEKSHSSVQTNIKQKPVSMLDGEAKKRKELNKSQWWMVILAFASGLIFMYLLRFIPSFASFEKSKKYSQKEALTMLYPHINESDDIEKMVRDLYKKQNGDKNIKIDKKKLQELLNKINSNNKS